jgi:predicted enzyme related to lactoylglutathione lyase
MLLGLRTVIYKVADLQLAKEWYSKAFRIEPYFDEPFYIGFNVGGFELGLDPDMSGVQQGNASTTYWGVNDVKQTVQELQEKFGVAVLEEPHNVGGPIWVATIADPFGNNIGLIENPEFGA